MKATFLVDVDTGDDTDLPSVSRDIESTLVEGGISVLEVKPWARKSTKLSSLFGNVLNRMKNADGR